jgi:RNA polymerase sigma-70 factor (ECF subfamily)
MTPPDKERFVQLIQENKGTIYKVCNSYCTITNERDDLTQEIIYQLWKSFPHFDSGFKFSTWMYRIALNVAISFYGKENRSVARVAFSENMILFEEQADEHAETENNLALLLRFINELKEKDRTIINKQWVKDFIQRSSGKRITKAMEFINELQSLKK